MAVTYNVYRDGSKVKSGLSQKNYKDTGLTPNTQYEYQVSAQNAAGESALSSAVTVTTDYSAPKGVNVNPNSATVDVGGTKDFNANVNPDTAKQGVNWSIDKTNVATIDNNGKVTAKAAGNATVTATSKADNSVKGTASLTVNEPTVPVNSVTVTPKTATITEGSTKTLTADIAPNDATNKGITWSSSDSAIATVNNSGKVTAVKQGNATITATSDADNSKKDTCDVTVEAKKPSAPQNLSVAGKTDTTVSTEWK